MGKSSRTPSPPTVQNTLKPTNLVNGHEVVNGLKTVTAGQNGHHTGGGGGLVLRPAEYLTDHRVVPPGRVGDGGKLVQEILVARS